MDQTLACLDLCHISNTLSSVHRFNAHSMKKINKCTWLKIMFWGSQKYATNQDGVRSRHHTHVKIAYLKTDKCPEE